MGNACIKTNTVQDNIQCHKDKKPIKEVDLTPIVKYQDEDSYSSITAGPTSASSLQIGSMSSDTMSFGEKDDDEQRNSTRICIRRENDEVVDKQIENQLVQTASFLPTQLIEHLMLLDENRRTLNKSTIMEAEVLEAQACILFIDISGFTRLTESMSRSKNGAEKLGFVVNAFFKKLLSKILSMGGDVERFAGDALITMFWRKSNEKDINKASMRALLCAHEIIQDVDLRKFKISKHKYLTLHVALGMANCEIYHIGGIQGKFERLVFSEAFTKMEEAIAEANDGEVVITQDTFEELQDHIAATRIVHSNAYLFKHFLHAPPVLELARALPISQRHLPIMKKFIESHTLELIESGHDLRIFGSGIKMASIVFISVDVKKNATNRNERLDIWNNLIQSVQKSVDTYEGFIGNFLHDEKGVDIIIAFGHPKTHLNDPYRAIRCALEVKDHLEENEDLLYGLGVTTGKVFIGQCGSKERRDCTILGDPVNVAARLMKVSVTMSEGQIICDKRTIEKTEQQVEYNQLDDISLKGKSKPLSIYEVISERNVFDTTNKIESLMPSVRQNAFTKMTKFLFENVKRNVSSQIPPTPVSTVIQRGFPLIMLIEGKSGSGKSHLVQNLIQLAANKGLGEISPNNISLQRANALDQQKSFSYFKSSFATALTCYDTAQILKKKNQRSVTARRHKLYQSYGQKRKQTIIRSIMDKSHEPYLYMFNSIFEVNFEKPKDELSKKQGKQMQLSLFKHFMTTTYTISQQHLDVTPNVKDIRILEDFQLIDARSRNLFGELFLGAPNAINMNAILIIVTNSDFESKSSMNRFRRSSKEVIVCNPLDETEMETLIIDEVNNEREEVEIHEIEHDFIKYMIDKAHGNIQIASLLTHKLLKNNLIGIEEETLSINPIRRHELEDVSLPTSVALLVQQRIDSLNPNARAVIKFASIVGMNFTMDLIHELLPEGNSALKKLDTHINTLVNENFLHKKSERTFDGRKIYEFNSPVTRDIAYQSTLLDTRQQAHGKLGEILTERNMIKRKTKDYTEVNSDDRQLNEILLSISEHFANSLASVQEVEYAALAQWIIELTLDEVVDIENDLIAFKLLTSYISILDFLDDPRKDEFRLNACAKLARAAFCLKIKLSQKELLDTTRVVDKCRDYAEQNNLTDEHQYLEIVSFKWIIHHENHQHRINIQLLKSLERDDSFTNYLIHTLMCLSYFGLSLYKKSLEHYHLAQEIQLEDPIKMTEMSRTHTLFHMELGAMMHCFGGMSAFLNGQYVLANHAMLSTYKICQREKDAVASVLTTIEGLYQLAFTGEPYQYEYFLKKYGLNLLNDPSLANDHRLSYYQHVLEFYHRHCQSLKPNRPLDTLLADFYTLKELSENEDFEDVADGFYYATMSTGLRVFQFAISSSWSSKFIPVLIDLFHFNQNHMKSDNHVLTSLMNIYHGLILMYMEYLVNRQLHTPKILNILNKTSLPYRAWIDQGISMVRHIHATTFEIIGLSAKLESAILLNENVSIEEIEEDVDDLKQALLLIPQQQRRRHLPHMKEAKRVLSSASQLLKIYQLLVIVNDSDVHRIHISGISTVKEFKSRILNRLSLNQSAIKCFEFKDSIFNRYLPLSSLNHLTNNHVEVRVIHI